MTTTDGPKTALAQPGWWVDPLGRPAEPAARARPCLFLDRDGVINCDHGYVHSIDRFDLVPGIIELIDAARTMGFRVVVVTNQAGIGRGYYSEAAFRAFTQWIFDELDASGARIDRVYYCPVHPTAGLGPYRRAHDWRKPRPGMILAACADLHLAAARSLLVGDRRSDIEAGRAAGLASTLLFTDGAVLDDQPADNEICRVHQLADVINVMAELAGPSG